LPGVARIGEDFLIPGETRIENDFAAAARDRPGRAAAKDPAVFQRKEGGAVQNLGQCCLLRRSFFLRICL
jgi:hypothetical protein